MVVHEVYPVLFAVKLVKLVPLLHRDVLQQLKVEVREEPLPVRAKHPHNLTKYSVASHASCQLVGTIYTNFLN